ncbi:glutathione S-transferase [Powellomyces hirtus]|nr:glutathione S-transferase [Powellomyces hirtus]
MKRPLDKASHEQPQSKLPPTATKMGLTFYYHPQSTACATAAALAELNLPNVERKLTKLGAEGTRTTEYLTKVNPNGTVPTLVLEDGTSIWESAAIAIYLGDTYGVERGLYPAAGTSQRAEAIKWIVWANTVLSAAASKLEEPATAEKGKTGVNAALKIIDDSLSKKSPYLLGEKYTLVDAHVYEFVVWVSMCNIDIKPYTHMSKWFATLGERPALKSVE